MDVQKHAWIVEEQMQHDWLAPWNEEWCIWPHNHTGLSDEVVFVKDSINSVVNRVVDSLVTGTNRCIGASVGATQQEACQYHIIPTKDDFIVYPVRITHAQSPDVLFGRINHFVDCDSHMRASLKDCDDFIIVALPVRTIRFDESQHLLLAVKGLRIIWSAWTIEEQTIQIRRIPEEVRTIKIELKMHVFCFRRRSSLIGDIMFEGMQRLIVRLFSSLVSEDIARLIAQHLRNSCPRITPQQFGRGAADGVLNYATARLLRIAYHRGLNTNVRSIVKQHTNIADRSVKRAFKERARIYERAVCHKRTRSGGVY